MKKIIFSNNGIKNNIYVVLFVVFLIGLIASFGMMGYNAWLGNKAQQNFENLLGTETENETETVVESETEETETEVDILTERGITIPEKNLVWDDLYKTNEHIYAWIYVPNTSVDYPVLQHPTDDIYYLRHNLDGSAGHPGCIYSEHKYNSKDWTDFNTLLFGHNLDNGLMFTSLHKFEDSTFFEENRYVYIYTPEHVYVYDIFGAYVYGDTHILAQYNSQSESRRQDYLDVVFDIRDMSAHFRKDVEVTTESNLLTLVTCINGRPDNRYIVQGVLINPPVVDEAE